jgi:hypothetical protein
MATESRRWRSLAVYAAPILLCAVALFQRYLVYAHALDPWKGGGFGMFSSIHAKGVRYVSVTLILKDGQEHRIGPRGLDVWLPMSGRMDRIQETILIMPSPSQVRRLARELAASQWVQVEGHPLPALRSDVPASVTAEPLEPRAIRVDVWEYGFDPQAPRLVLGNLLHVTEEVPADVRRA